jgi:hypothetical protein
VASEAASVDPLYAFDDWQVGISGKHITSRFKVDSSSPTWPSHELVRETPDGVGRIRRDHQDLGLPFLYPKRGSFRTTSLERSVSGDWSERRNERRGQDHVRVVTVSIVLGSLGASIVTLLRGQGVRGFEVEHTASRYRPKRLRSVGCSAKFLPSARDVRAMIAQEPRVLGPSLRQTRQSN